MPTGEDFKKNQFKTTSRHPDSTSNEAKNESKGDSIILAVVIWMFVSQLFYNLSTDYYSEAWFVPLSTLMSLIWGIVPILLAFAVKDKSKQPIIFSLGGLYFAYNFYKHVMPFINL